MDGQLEVCPGETVPVKRIRHHADGVACHAAGGLCGQALAAAVGVLAQGLCADVLPRQPRARREGGAGDLGADERDVRDGHDARQRGDWAVVCADAALPVLRLLGVGHAVSALAVEDAWDHGHCLVGYAGVLLECLSEHGEELGRGGDAVGAAADDHFECGG